VDEVDLWIAWVASPVASVAAAVFGALWGSFFNVCIARVPAGLSVVRPPSHCFACKAPVRAFDNIPILSYFILRGRCRACGVKFSPRYALVEALMAGLAWLLWSRLVAGADGVPLGVRFARFALGFAFTGVLLVLSFIDLDTKRLPDIITLPSIPVFFLAGFGAGQVAWLERLIGGVAGYLVVRIIADGYYYLTGREGLGLGDGKLLAVIGVVVGWRALPLVIFAAAALGIVVSVPLLLIAHRRRAVDGPVVKAAAPGAGAGEAAGAAEGDATGEGEDAEESTSLRRTEVPFGPFLALSGFVYFLVGDQIRTWFTGLMLGE
jgi:leader peptidase (prepilin peptidase)/N-methyltransferase